MNEHLHFTDSFDGIEMGAGARVAHKVSTEHRPPAAASGTVYDPHGAELTGGVLDPVMNTIMYVSGEFDARANEARTGHSELRHVLTPEELTNETAIMESAS